MRLSRHFLLEEFRSKDGAPFPNDVVRQLKLLCVQLEIVRDIFGSPITIHSGYRSKNRNTLVRGSPRSQHLFGRAADFRFTKVDVTDPVVYRVLDGLMNRGVIKMGGLGWYPDNSRRKGYIHLDTRGRRARWPKKALSLLK